MLIRRYQKRDWDRVCDIFRRAKPDEMKGSCNPDMVVPLEQDGRLNDLFHQSTVYVAVMKGKIIGFTGYQGSLITFLFVDPDDYRRGAATRLLQQVIADIGDTAWLHVAKNNLPARHLYRKFGFKTVDEFLGKYHGHTIEVLRLAIKPDLQT